MAVVLGSVVVAVAFGFALQRAGVCTVKAVAEPLTTGRAYMLASLSRAALWTVAATLLMAGLGAGTAVTVVGHPVAWQAAVGGLVFGMGAAVNGACAFSILSYLGSGHLGMLATLAGFCFGVAVLAAGGLWPAHAELPLAWSPAAATGALAWFVHAVVLSWAVYEGWRLWRRTRSSPLPVRARLFADRYSLSAGAAVIGSGAGLLFAAHGRWPYTRLLADQIDAVVASGPGPTAVQALLFAAVVGGVALSASLRGRFEVRVPRLAEGLRHLAGGALMGLGAAMVPGGTFVIVLHWIPVLSPHAVVAFPAMLAGIALVLIAMRWATGRIPRVDCAGDVCSD